MSEVRFCSRCGAQREGLATACRQCGQSFKGNAHAVSSPSPALLGLVVLCVGLFVTGALTWLNGAPRSFGANVAAVTEVTSTLTPTPTPSATPKAPLGTFANPYPSGGNIMVGDIRWRIMSSSTPASLADAFGSRVSPQGKLVVVVAEVENMGKSPETVTQLNIVDGKGRKFAALDGANVEPPTIAFETLNPNLPLRYSTVFDLPLDAKDLRATVSDLALIDPKVAYVLLDAERSSIPTATPEVSPSSIVSATPTVLASPTTPPAPTASLTPSIFLTTTVSADWTLRDHAIAVLNSKGDLPVNASQWQLGADFQVLIGSSSLGGISTQQAYFFYRGSYLGTDTIDRSGAITELSRDGNAIILEYELYRPSDSPCCATGGLATVRYRWDGEHVVPMDPIPTSNPNAPLSRR